MYVVVQVEQRVRELEEQISHGQCANLAEEKKVMNEIKQLNATKSLIVQYQNSRQNQSDDSETKGGEKTATQKTGAGSSTTKKTSSSPANPDAVAHGVREMLGLSGFLASRVSSGTSHRQEKMTSDE